MFGNIAKSILKCILREVQFDFNTQICFQTLTCINYICTDMKDLFHLHGALTFVFTRWDRASLEWLRRHHVLLLYGLDLLSKQYLTITCIHYPTPE